jgi:protein required for attachment to host cells
VANSAAPWAARNWHELEQAEFARTLTDRLNRLALEDRFDAIVIAADPETLGQMRESYHDGLLERLVAEIDKNYTHAPIPEIERRLRDHAVKA